MSKTAVTPKPHKTRKPSKTRRPASWSYRGANGPEAWGKLDPAYNLCTTGQRQSPVNIEGVEAAHLDALSIHYKISVVEIIKKNRTVHGSYGKGSHIILGNDLYELQGFDIRTPSEHTIAGRAFPMEIQFRHRSKKGKTVIVSLLAFPGNGNLAAREIWDRLPPKGRSKARDNRALMNARDLLPDSTKHFRYAGSLTAPPCTEQVDWLVLQMPVSFSDSQIAAIRAIAGKNARPVQARNSRYVLQQVGG